MANADNLIKNSERTPSERQEFARKGGIASGEARREKRRIREALEIALNGSFECEDGQTLSGYEAITAAIVKQALNGNVQAFKEIRDTIGERPTDTVEIGSSEMTGIKIKFVDKSHKREQEKDPKIIGDYTPPQNYAN